MAEKKFNFKGLTGKQVGMAWMTGQISRKQMNDWFKRMGRK